LALGSYWRQSKVASSILNKYYSVLPEAKKQLCLLSAICGILLAGNFPDVSVKSCGLQL
jgi:hypothetical protein